MLILKSAETESSDIFSWVMPFFGNESIDGTLIHSNQWNWSLDGALIFILYLFLFFR